MQNIFIYLLIIAIFSLIIYKPVEGVAGPKVGSVIFPNSISGTTTVNHKPLEITEKNQVKSLVKTKIHEKKDQRVQKKRTGEHWHESREDVDVKKDVDVVHRYPEIWNEASLIDCHEKKETIHKDYKRLKLLKNRVRLLFEYRLPILQGIQSMKNNIPYTIQKVQSAAATLSTSPREMAKVSGPTTKQAQAQALARSSPPELAPIESQTFIERPAEGQIGGVADLGIHKAFQYIPEPLYPVAANIRSQGDKFAGDLAGVDF